MVTLCLLSFCSVSMRSGERSLHAVQHAYVCQSGPPLRLLHLCGPPKRYSHMDFQVLLHGPCTAVLHHRYKSNCHLRCSCLMSQRGCCICIVTQISLPELRCWHEMEQVAKVRLFFNKFQNVVCLKLPPCQLWTVEKSRGGKVNKENKCVKYYFQLQVREWGKRRQP